MMRMRLFRAVERFLDELRLSKSPATVIAYQADLTQLFAMALLSDVSHFTPELVRNHLIQLSTLGRSRETLRRHLSVARIFGYWGMRHGLWSTNPTAMMPTIRPPKYLPRPFSKDEERRLLALELPPTENVLRAVLFLTGLRVSPICGIKLQDISFDPPTIWVVVKGAKQQVVPMHEDLKELLSSYIGSLINPPSQSYLFVRPNGQPQNRGSIELITKRWGAAARVLLCQPHRFRHTFATRLVEAGVDIRIIKELLGHANISSTLIYTQVSNATLTDAIRRLPWGRG